MVNNREVASIDYPNVEEVTYSPLYKPEFSEEENAKMIAEVNAFQPDVLFVGMTAPKQEKWASENFDKLNAGHVGCIGAVFDFYARTINRAPQWMINYSLEWFYRFVKEPRRMYKRYVVGNAKFVWAVHQEKLRRYREGLKENKTILKSGTQNKIRHSVIKYRINSTEPAIQIKKMPYQGKKTKMQTR